MKKFLVTYLSGQTLIFKGESLEQVAKQAEDSIAQFKIGRPHVGIASVVAVN